MSILDRHEDKWTPEPNSGCFLWHGSHGSGGYGKIKLLRRRVVRDVHRLVCEEVNGPPPEGAQASHLCHTPACVNGDHLIWESRKENMARVTFEKAGARGRAMAINAGYVLREGVHPTKTNRWLALIGNKYLGTFDTQAEARAARNEAVARRREGIS